MKCKKCHGYGYITKEGTHLWNCYSNSSLNICDCGAEKNYICDECLGTKLHFKNNEEIGRYLDKCKKDIKLQKDKIKELDLKISKINQVKKLLQTELYDLEKLIYTKK